MAITTRNITMTEKMLRFGDIHLRYFTGGNPEGEPIMLVHGAGSNSSTWFRTIEHLQHCNWIAFDTRGFGKSNGRPDIQISADDVFRVADAEGFKEFFLAGICYGGTIALAACRKHPIRIKGIIVISPLDKKIVRLTIVLHVACALTYFVVKHLRDKPRKRTVNYRTSFRLPPLLSPPRDLLYVQAKHFALAGMQSINTLTLFNGIQPPLLVVPGSDDWSLRKDALAQRLAARPGVEVAHVKANHHILTWAPLDTAKLIDDFVQRHGSQQHKKKNSVARMQEYSVNPRQRTIPRT